MAEVIFIEDQNDLVPTSQFQGMNFPFEYFNPVQSRLFEVYQGDSNVIIAARTSAGKTVCSEMYMHYEMFHRGGKCIYIGPLKALAKEKHEDWSGVDHLFSKKRISICTGDFRLTESRKKELKGADIIAMTPEMLASLCRNYKSEKSSFLYDVGTLVFDESHLLTVPGRGDHIEVALMKIVDICPHARIVMLSATMPNVNEISGWLSEITGRDTYCLESKYRPCPLSVHYDHYEDSGSYDDKEKAKVSVALGIIEAYPDDKFLVFAHTKRTGDLMVESLKRNGIESEFHNANLLREKRHELEDRFRNDPKFRVLVATSGLAWGINAPARRVIILGVHRGLSEVENYDIEQMQGRSGRPKYDPRGDAHILIPDSKSEYYRAKLKKKHPIRSQMLEQIGDHYKTLAFHVVSEIHRGNITTKEEFYKWYEKSLARYQNHDFDDEVIDSTLELLLKYKAIKVEDGLYEATAVGKIASMFYYSPFDVSDLKSNFYKLFTGEHDDDNEIATSMALANIDTFKWGICNRIEKEEMASFGTIVSRMYGRDAFNDSAIKIGYAYSCLLKGKHVPAFSSTIEMLRNDSDRLMEVLFALDSMAGKWNKQDYFKVLQQRLKYGVPEYLIDLVKVPNIGKARAEKLWKAGIKKPSDLVHNASKLTGLLRISKPVADKMVDHAKEQMIHDML